MVAALSFLRQRPAAPAPWPSPGPPAVVVGVVIGLHVHAEPQYVAVFIAVRGVPGVGISAHGSSVPSSMRRLPSNARASSASAGTVRNSNRTINRPGQASSSLFSRQSSAIPPLFVIALESLHEPCLVQHPQVDHTGDDLQKRCGDAAGGVERRAGGAERHERLGGRREHQRAHHPGLALRAQVGDILLAQVPGQVADALQYIDDDDQLEERGRNLQPVRDPGVSALQDGSDDAEGHTRSSTHSARLKPSSSFAALLMPMRFRM